MQFSIPAILLLISLGTVLIAQAQDYYYDTKVDQEWTTANLYCSNATGNTAPNGSEPVSWMLPNRQVIYSGQSGDKYEITQGNWTLVVYNVTKNDLGLYHCLLKTPSSQWFLVSLGLNAGGPYFQSIWLEYQMNTIIGFSVAGGFALLVLAIYLIDHFKYVEKEEEENKSNESTQVASTEVNPDYPGYILFQIPENGAAIGGKEQEKTPPGYETANGVEAPYATINRGYEELETPF